MNAEHWADSKIIAAIKNGGLERERAIKHLYTEQDWRGLVRIHVLKNSGNESDGKDLAQDAIIALEQNIRADRFNGLSNLKTYFMSIVKNQWLKRLRDRKPVDEFQPEQYEETDGNVEDGYITGEQRKYLDMLLNKTGERCKKMLVLKQTGYKLEEIAKEIGLSSASMAKKEIYRCRQKLRDFLNANPGWLDLLE